MTDVATQGPTLAQIPIRYDGLDAAEHKIELAALGESLTGVARVLAVVGHFVVTLEYAKQYQAQDVRVLVEEPRANCYSLVAVLEWVKEYQLASGAATVGMGALLQWLYGRAAGRREEMKLLKSSLDNAITELAHGHQATVDRALVTVERLAEGLTAAIRQSVAPVGKTCSSMTLMNVATIDEAAAHAIRSTEDDELTAERAWRVLVTELDVVTRTAKMALAENDDDARISAEIRDPSMDTRPNHYTDALAGGSVLVVKGKATLRDGIIKRLFVSDAKPEG